MFLGAIVFCFGTIIGSFLNVVVYRFRTGATIVNDRSRCMSCGKKLMPRMLIPILSFVFQKGRCAYCQTKLSWQYPLTEFFEGIIALSVYLVLDVGIHAGWYVFLKAIVAFVFFSVLLVITLYDWRHKIIPDRLSLLLGLLGGGYALLLSLAGERHFSPSLYAGLGVSVPFVLLWMGSRGKWMGLGDAKLIVGLGFFLGYPIALSMPILAFWLGTIPAILLLLFRKGITMKSEIPFGPFLALATFLLYVYPIDILQLQTIWPDILG